MIARRDFAQALCFGLGSLVLRTPAVHAQQLRDQNVKSRNLFPNGVSSTGWMKFEMPDDRYIVLSGMLNNERVEMVLDSAVGPMVLDSTVASKLGLRAKGETLGVGITAATAARIIEGPTLSIGNLVLKAPEAMAFDLTSFNVATNRPIMALLGRDVFASLLVDIDFEARRIAFRDPEVPAMVTGAKLEPLPPTKFGRKLLISVEGQRPIDALFDLGSDTPLIISPDYVEKVHLLQGKRTSTLLSVGAEGVEEDSVASIKTIEVGGLSAHDVPVSVPKKWAQDVPAVVGVPILSRFRLMTDFSRDLIWMLPYKDAETKAFQKDRLGMAAMPANDCLRVVHVSPGSPAEVGSLKVGDEVVTINDQAIDDAYLKSRVRQGMKPAGTILQLRLRSGSKLTMKLADYY